MARNAATHALGGCRRGHAAGRRRRDELALLLRGARPGSRSLLEQTSDFQLPILLFHGTDDEVIPIETSEDFAAELPKWGTYYAVPEAGHRQGWNVDPRLYKKRLARFLSQIPAARA
jgi:fermentation-respiration switch protein FrsA (DUF1100 family)